MELPLTGIGAFIDCLVLIFFFYKLSKSSSKNNNFLKFFKGFALYFSLFYLLFSVPLILIPNNSSVIGIGYLIGHAFSYIAFGFLARVAFLLAKPAYDSRFVFYGYLITGAIITLANLIYFNFPTVENGIASWNQNSFVGVAIIIFGLTAFLPVAFLFIKEAFLQPKNRKRYALIGIAVLLMIISGPMHDVATTSSLLLTADVITTSAFIMLFIGVSSEQKKIST